MIESGEKKKILELDLKIDKDEFDKILLKRSKIFSQISALLESKDINIFHYKEIDLYLSEHERWHIEEYFENLKAVPIFEQRQKWHIEYFKSKLVQYVPVNEQISVTLEFSDENNNEYKNEFTMEKGDLWFNEKELKNNPKQLYYSLRKPEDIYLVILCPEKNRNKKYNLSHYIKGGDVERLHFLFASEKTADYVVQFVFYFNKSKKIQSDLFKLSLYTENRKDFFYDKIHDGSHFALNDGEWKLQ
jgi:hypothetical protein